MRRDWPALIFGLLLVLLGALLLLQNLGILPFWTIIWIVLFAAGGVALLYIFFSDPEKWWALIPGFILLGISALILLGEFFPAAEDTIGGPFFLLAISASFWIIYLIHREHWWAIIPGGVLLSVAVVAALENVALGFDPGGIVLLGIGLTFLLLAMVPIEGMRMRWPLIPGGILLLIGIVVMAGEVAVLQYVWPAALILGGLYLVVRNFGAPSQPQDPEA
ncbi:MAG: hypothetical protein ACLFV5_00670 [Anaerolineales bacterium]